LKPVPQWHVLHGIELTEANGNGKQFLPTHRASSPRQPLPACQSDLRCLCRLTLKDIV